MSADQPTPPKANRRWFLPTPGKLLVVLLTVEGILFLANWLHWIPKGWAVTDPTPLVQENYADLAANDFFLFSMVSASVAIALETISAKLLSPILAAKRWASSLISATVFLT